MIKKHLHINMKHSWTHQVPVKIGLPVYWWPFHSHFLVLGGSTLQQPLLVRFTRGIFGSSQQPPATHPATLRLQGGAPVR
jgi:hypothetical protein